MLALVHPFNPSADAPHRTPSSNRNRAPHHRKPSSREASSSSLASASSFSSSLYSTAKPASSSLAMNGSSSSSRIVSQSAVNRQQHPPTLRSADLLPSVNTVEQASSLPAVTPVEVAAVEPSFDIHSYPPPDLLRLLASLLTQIASTNDKLDVPNIHSPSSVASSEPHNSVWRSLTTASRSALSTHSSTLTFHARNIPTISLESYLLRILKYCPTTNEVFLSLLVYFDRMTKLTLEATGRSFVIDSYNIHRLVIAGVTVASKFFSDVFYTNSRYAKVGGLPLAELNQLELQFLLLNNFTLVIPKDEMQRYAEQLILFSSNNSSSSVPLPSISSLSSPSSSIPSTPRPAGAIPTAASPRHHDIAAPMRSMGAIDAYGGRIPGSESHTPFVTGPTVNAGAPLSRQAAHRGMEPNALSRVINSHQHHPHHALNGSVNGYGFSSSSSRLRRQEDSESESGEGTGAETETETETEAETEAETETDGGWTTDDEPTIRPPKSSAGSSSSSSRSSGASDARSTCSSTSEGGEGDDESEDHDHIMDDIDEEEGGRTPEHGARVRGGDDTEVEVEVAKDAERTPERRPFLGMSKITPPGRQEHGVLSSP